MIIALTGTPGTGKTSIASKLKQLSTINVINLHTYAKEHNLVDGFDSIRKSDIIDSNKLNKSIQQQIISDSNVIILDGHLSHLLTCVSKTIVLRCHPHELKKRLLQKNWSIEKIQENVEAEILDIIESEAVELHSFDHVIELDTTQTSINKTSQIIYSLIQTGFSDIGGFKPGTIDWSNFLLSDESKEK